jgi:hypothetical protein
MSKFKLRIPAGLTSVARVQGSIFIELEELMPLGQQIHVGDDMVSRKDDLQG